MASLLEKRRKSTQQNFEQTASDRPAQRKSQDTETSVNPKMNLDLGTTIQTSYQRNMFNPTETKPWYKGEIPTAGEVYAQIGEIAKTDPARARNSYMNFKRFQADSTSPFYNPYSQTTNNAARLLAEMGMDTSNINDDWFRQNSWLKDHYVYTGTTNTPSSPGKKATLEQQAAYQYYQLAKSEEQTKKAETEWAALQEELAFKANRSDRNYTDDQIIAGIDWRKYPTLAKMNDSLTDPDGVIMEFNRGIGYNKDAMYGTLWAARNDGGTGNIELDLANMAMGSGNQWQYDEDISERLNPTSERYAPYTVGSTLEEETLYFGRETFDQQWLDDNRNILNGNDQTAIKNYQAVYAAEKKTQKAEAELASLNEKMKGWLSGDNAVDPDKIISKLEKELAKSDYSTLRAMDDSLGSGKLLDTTRAVGFSKADLFRQITDACAANAAKKGDAATQEEIADTAGVHEPEESITNASSEETTSEQYVIPSPSVGVPGEAPIYDDKKDIAPGDVDSVSGPSGSTGLIGITASNGKLPTMSEEQKKVAAATDEKLREGYDIIGDDATQAESEVFSTQGSSTFDNTVGFFGAFKQRVFDARDALAANLTMKSAGVTSSAILEGSDLIADYEQNHQKLESLRERERELAEELDVMAGYDGSVPTGMKTSVTVDGKKVKVLLRYNAAKETFEFAGPQDGESLDGVDMDALGRSLEGAINGANQHRQDVLTAMSLEPTEEQIVKLDEYNRLLDSISELQTYEDNNAGAYQDANAAMQRATILQGMTIAMLKNIGADTEALENCSAVTGFFQDFTKYDPTQWNAYSAYDSYANEIRFGGAKMETVYEEAKASNDEVTQALELAQWSLEYADKMGIQIPDGVRANMERYIAKLERTQTEFEYFDYTHNDDFKEEAKRGKEMFDGIQLFDYAAYDREGFEGQPLWNALSPEKQEEIRQLNDTQGIQIAAYAYETALVDADIDGSRLGFYDIQDLMTGYEQDTYYYLLATQGVDAAQEYYNFLTDDTYGILHTRAAEETQAAGEQLARDLPVLANIQSVLLAPVAAVSSGFYALKTGLQKLAGQDVELNPNNVAYTVNLFRNATMSGTSQLINDTFGEGTVGAKIAQAGLEIFRNRGDSIVNAMTFSGIFPWMNNIPNEMLQEFVGALPMGISAAADTAAEAKRNGATDEQAYAVAGVTLLAETVTEAISLDNIKNAFGAGVAGSETVKDWLKNWITRAGLSEALGETINDFVENTADRLIMGENSERSRLIEKYKSEGMSQEDAEAAAIRDELAGYLHTALISYITPGLDIVSYAAGKFSGYRQQTRQLQQMGMNVSILDVMRADREGRRRTETPTETNTTTPTAPAEGESTAAPETAETVRGEGQQETKDRENAPDLTRQKAIEESVAVDWEILETVAGDDTSENTQTAAVASVLAPEGNPVSEIAKAASAKISGLFGSAKEAVNEMQAVLLGAQMTNTDPELVKQALTNAALSESSTARRVVESDQYRKATPDQQAQMLAESTRFDNANHGVRVETATAVHEHRVAVETQRQIAAGAMDGAKEASAQADAAALRTSEAQNQLKQKQEAVTAASEAIASANTEYNEALDSGDADRLNDAEHQLEHTIAEKEKASAVKEEYEQHLAKAQEEQQKAEQKAKDAKSDALVAVRQQAETTVQQQEQAEAEAAAQAAAEEQARQEVEAQAQAEEDQRSGKAQEVDEYSKIESFTSALNVSDEQKAAIEKRMKERRDQKTLGRIDMTGKLSNAEGYLALSAFERKTGLKIQFSDDLGPARGKYANGVVYLNRNLAKGGQMTIGQALVECSLHEITHSLENTKNYEKYSNTVLDILYGGTDNAKYKAAISKKIADYAENGVTLKPEDAKKELVADFARTNLNQKDVVQRFMDNGLGGRMRNILHNINQAIRNFKLTGKEKETAENLRRAERLFQKALDEKARTSAHPAGEQFSIPQFAQSVGLFFNEKDGKMYDKEGGREITKDDIDVGMIENTPVGKLIDAGITGEQNQKAKQMMTDLMKLCVQYNDSNLVWEIAATTLSSTFSAVKSNSDKQYSNTIDFGTICAKTQEIVNVLSDVMVQRVKEGKTGGLTRKEVMKVYDATHKANLTVPCPVCYVFSRWMGVPSLLGQISEFQNNYVETTKDENGKTVLDKNGKPVIDWDATSKLANDYIKNALNKYGDKDGVTDAKTSLQGKIAKLEDKVTQLRVELAKAKADQKEEVQKRLDDALDQQDKAEADLKEVEAYNWITQALCKQKRKGKKTIDVLDADGNHVVDKSFELTPDEILFDLRRTAEFANYAKNWRYRNTRGAGMGKAIMPYSGMAIGDVIYGDKPRRLTGNPFIETGASIKRAMNDARKRAAKQNLIGGQRLQSTSDFRPEWGLDYIMAFLELQAMKSKAQMYTKVPEALDFLASVGADVNMSIMAQGNGYHIATDEEIAKMSQRDIDTKVVEFDGKKYVMDFSPITGMRYETAMDYNDKYNNVQPILVGMNDTHIRLAMLNDHISFIIPWHSSGNSKDVLQTLVGSVGERLEESSDYTDTQSDAKIENRTAAQENAWNARMKILQGNATKMTAEEWEAVHGNPALENLYNRFYTKGVDPDCYHVKLSKDQASQIFPYEYWNKGSTRENADENGKLFVKYCQMLGMTPRFSGVVKHNDDGTFTVTGNFAGAVYDENGNITGYDESKMDSGYWKVLIDRPMYENNVLNEDGTVKEYGKYREQQTIDVTNARVGELDENHSLVNSDLPKNTEAKYVSYDPRNPNYGLYEERHKDAVMNAHAMINKAPDLTGQLSIDGDITDADIDQMLRDAGVDYQDAVGRGDMEAAQEDAEFGAETPANDFSDNGLPVQVRNDGMMAVHNLSAQNLRRTLRLGGFPYPSIAVISKDRGWNDFGEISIVFNQNVVDPAMRSGGLYVGDADTPTMPGMPETMEEALQSMMTQPERSVPPSLTHAFAYSKKVESLEEARERLQRNKGRTHEEKLQIFQDMDAAGSDIQNKVFNFFQGRGMQGYDLSGVNKGILEAAEAIDTLGNLSRDQKRDVIEDHLRSELLKSKRWNENMRLNGEDGEALADSIIDFIDYANQIVGTDMLESKPSRDIHFSEIKAVSLPNTTPQELIDQVMEAGIDAGNIYLYDPNVNGDRDRVLRSIPEQVEGASFSIGGEMTDADIDQMLIEAGVPIDEYSAPLEGMNPMASTAVGEAQRQFGSEGGMLSESDELDRRVVSYVMNQNGYTPDTNAEQLGRAVKWIRNNRSTPNSDGLYESVQKVASNSFDYRSADGQARMIALMGLAAAKNDIMAQITLADAFNRQGTDLGRQLQARKMFRLMTPEGRIASLEKMAQDVNDEFLRKGYDKGITFSDWIYRAAAAAQTEDEFQTVRQAAAHELAEQIPANWKDKLRGWRMLSMLGNPRTHIRNIVGNALFVPVVSMKNKLGAVGEIITGQKDRTKTLAFRLPAEIRTFTREDAIAMQDTLTGEAKYKEGDLVRREAKPFKGLLQAIIDFNSGMLEKEDWIFLKGHYQRALGGWMQANGYTASQLRNNPDLLEQGRAYAIQEAQKATYRDFSQLASTLNSVSRKGGVAGFVVDAALPFKKTPANILKRGIEYSPAGLMRSLTADIYHLKQWVDAQNGKLAAMPEKAISPTQFIDRLCAGLSGSAILAVGALLSSMGVVSCGLGDDEDKLEKEQGNQEYSLKLSLFGHDFTYTVDWAAPMSMPFFVGAAIQEQLASQDGFDIESLVNAFGNITEPVFNLSMLDGVNSLLSVSSYGDDGTNTITQIGAKIASNYVTSYVPSLLGAIARTVDDTRRKSFVESGKGTGIMGTFRYAREQVENKIPGLSQTNIPVRNVWGEASTSSLAERIVENFISPGYIEDYRNDPILNEMARLYEIAGDNKMIPSDPAKTVTYKKHKYVFSAEEWDTYKAERGQAALQVLSEMIGSEDYIKADDNTKLAMIKNAWSYADSVGKAAVIPGYEMDKKGDNPLAAISSESKISTYKENMITSLENGDMEGYETMVEALRQEGVEDSTIKGKIGDTYRDRYKAAYTEYNYDAMAEIESILEDTGFDFDTDAWEDQVDKKLDR